MAFDITCCRCGEEGLAWKEVQDKYHLITSHYTRHHCSGSTNTTPITTRAGVTEHAGTAKSQPMSEGVKVLAQSAVLDAVAEVRGTFDRAMEEQADIAGTRIVASTDAYTKQIRAARLRYKLRPEAILGIYFNSKESVTKSGGS